MSDSATAADSAATVHSSSARASTARRRPKSPPPPWRPAARKLLTEVISALQGAAQVDPAGCPNVVFLVDDATAQIALALDVLERDGTQPDDIVSPYLFHAEALVLGARGLAETPAATEYILDRCLTLLDQDFDDLRDTGMVRDMPLAVPWREAGTRMLTEVATALKQAVDAEDDDAPHALELIRLAHTEMGATARLIADPRASAADVPSHLMRLEAPLMGALTLLQTNQEMKGPLIDALETINEAGPAFDAPEATPGKVKAEIAARAKPMPWAKRDPRISQAAAIFAELAMMAANVIAIMNPVLGNLPAEMEDGDDRMLVGARDIMKQIGFVADLGAFRFGGHTSAVYGADAAEWLLPPAARQEVQS